MVRPWGIEVEKEDGVCLKRANRHEGWGVEGGELARTGEGAGGPGPGSTMSATPSMAEGEEGQAQRRKCSDVVLLRLQGL